MDRRGFLKSLPLIAGSFYLSCKGRGVNSLATNQNKLVFLGIDGAHWPIVNDLRAKGLLPNWDYLIKNGASGILNSFEPMYSPIIWSTMLSGTTMDKHGINGFVARLRDSGSRAEIILPSLPKENYKASIEAMRCPGIKEQNVRIHINSKEVAVLHLQDKWSKYTFTIPADIIDAKRNVLTLVHDTVARISIKDEAKVFLELMKAISNKDKGGKKPLAEDDLALHEFESLTSKDPTLTLTAAYKTLYLEGDVKTKVEIGFGDEKTYPMLRSGWYGMPNVSMDFLWAGRDKVIPVTAVHRKRPLLWEIISGCGGSAGSVAFWTTWPASKINPFLVTDHVCYIHILNRDILVDEKQDGLTYPKHLASEISSLVVNPDEIKGEAIKPFIRDFDEADLTNEFPSDMEMIKEAQSTLLTYGNIALNLQKRYIPQSLFLYIRSTDVISHYFWDSLEPDKFENLNKKHAQAFRESIYAIYKEADVYIGKLLKLAPDSNFIICSDHGFRASPEMRVKGWHEKKGFMCFSGPQFNKGTKLNDAQMLDITPTILTLLGLPKASDMDGRVIEDAFRQDFLKESLRNRQRIVDPYPMPQGAGKLKEGSTYDEEILRRLKSLGYIN
jgi:hypothetical protein